MNRVLSLMGEIMSCSKFGLLLTQAVKKEKRNNLGVNYQNSGVVRGVTRGEQLPGRRITPGGPRKVPVMSQVFFSIQ